jgi:hypothetical protein
VIYITYKKELEREDNFIKLYKFTCQLPKEQAFMLSYLIDAEDFVEVRLRTDNRYFECTNEFVKTLLIGWSDAEINNAQQKLKEADYIDIIKVPIDNSGFIKYKFIKLNIDNIDKLRFGYNTQNRVSNIVRISRKLG